MSLARRASRIAATAAVGGAAVGGGGLGMLWAQTLLARHRVGEPRTTPFPVNGTYGSGSGPALRMAVMGDSGAAGLGADDPQDTVAVKVARGVAYAAGRPVELVNVAVVGAQTADLDGQSEAVATALGGEHADLVLIMIGANDVTHRVRPATSVRQLGEVVTVFVDGGTAVVVGCCPDLGTIVPVPNPLRTIGRRMSRTLAAAQALVTTQAGGHAVELGSLIGPEFAARPGEYFSEDRFHPSSVGYSRCAEELLPAALAALSMPAAAGHDEWMGSAEPA